MQSSAKIVSPGLGRPPNFSNSCHQTCQASENYKLLQVPVTYLVNPWKVVAAIMTENTSFRLWYAHQHKSIVEDSHTWTLKGHQWCRNLLNHNLTDTIPAQSGKTFLVSENSTSKDNKLGGSIHQPWGIWRPSLTSMFTFYFHNENELLCRMNVWPRGATSPSSLFSITWLIKVLQSGACPSINLAIVQLFLSNGVTIKTSFVGDISMINLNFLSRMQGTGHAIQSHNDRRTSGWYLRAQAEQLWAGELSSKLQQIHLKCSASAWSCFLHENVKTSKITCRHKNSKQKIRPTNTQWPVHHPLHSKVSYNGNTELWRCICLMSWMVFGSFVMQVPFMQPYGCCNQFDLNYNHYWPYQIYM